MRTTTNSANVTILLVDDEAAICDMLTLALETAGFSVKRLRMAKRLGIY